MMTYNIILVSLLLLCARGQTLSEDNIIDKKFQELYEAQAETKAAISGLSSSMKENKDLISDLSNRILSSVIPKINDLSSIMTENKFAIDFLRDLSSKNQLAFEEPACLYSMVARKGYRGGGKGGGLF